MDFFPLRIEQNQPNPPQQDSPVANLPWEKPLRQLTQGPSGTQWSEDLFHQPSRPNETPIPGPSQPSEPPEDAWTCEPEPGMAPTQSTKEPFATSVIIIDNMPIGSPQRSKPPPPLIPTMWPGRNLQTCDRPSLFLKQFSTTQSTKSCWSIADFSP
ncbi:hypothetical protein O181_005573 [Austropuccinia psidii MF-1]|uniref:Uncharacterized protein n=1 Tax=Austropuccinia psidii MF-1 TaxID=1389203 RepID=A0A9Q3BII3_9BASI|nr:hypothetical protein [Austropuccinia psidii MF-1]